LDAPIDGVGCKISIAQLLATAGVCNPQPAGQNWPWSWSFVARGPKSKCYEKNSTLFTYPYDQTRSPAPGFCFIQTALLHKQALRL